MEYPALYSRLMAKLDTALVELDRTTSIFRRHALYQEIAMLRRDTDKLRTMVPAEPDEEDVKRLMLTVVRPLSTWYWANRHHSWL